MSKFNAERAVKLRSVPNNATIKMGACNCTFKVVGDNVKHRSRCLTPIESYGCPLRRRDGRKLHYIGYGFREAEGAMVMVLTGDRKDRVKR